MTITQGILKKRNRALFVLFSGLATIAIWLLMFALSRGDMKGWSGTKNPPFSSAVVWLELSNSPEDAFACLGPAPNDPGADSESMRIRDTIDRIQIADFFFMPAYTALFIAIFLFLLSVPPPRFFFLVLVLCALIAWGADIRENILLFKITSFTSIEQAHRNSVAFTDLAIATRIKWSCLFALCLSIPYLSIKEMLRSHSLSVRALANGAAAACFLIAGIVGFTGIVFPQHRSLIESASMCMSAGWACVMIAGATYVRPV